MTSSVGAPREPAGTGERPPARDDLEEIELSLLLEGVYRQYGFDFREYAPASLRRRVWRRIHAEGLATVMVPCHIRYRPPAAVSAERNTGVLATRAPTPAATTMVIAA